MTKPEFGKWQQIETAPKDGTDVIVLLNVADVAVVHIAWWRDGELNAAGEFLEPGWWSYTLGSVTQELLNDYRSPTHWMPMPEPPEQGAQ